MLPSVSLLGMLVDHAHLDADQAADQGAHQATHQTENILADIVSSLDCALGRKSRTQPE